MKTGTFMLIKTQTWGKKGGNEILMGNKIVKKNSAGLICNLHV